MKVWIILVAVLLSFTACQKKEASEVPKANEKVVLKPRDYKTRPCTNDDLKTTYLSYRIDIFENPTYQFWEEPYQLLEFSENGDLRQISSSDEIVKDQFDKIKKSKPIISWQLSPESKLSFKHSVRPEYGHTMECGILTDSYPAEGHGFLPVLAGSLLLTYRCKEERICQQQIYRVMASEDELRPDYEHNPTKAASP